MPRASRLRRARRPRLQASRARAPARRDGSGGSRADEHRPSSRNARRRGSAGRVLVRDRRGGSLMRAGRAAPSANDCRDRSSSVAGRAPGGGAGGRSAHVAGPSDRRSGPAPRPSRAPEAVRYTRPPGRVTAWASRPHRSNRGDETSAIPAADAPPGEPGDPERQERPRRTARACRSCSPAARRCGSTPGGEARRRRSAAGCA